MANTDLSQPRLLGSWRRGFQWLLSLAVLLIPFARIAGESLLRVDLPSLSLYLGGRALAVDELYLLLLASIALVLLFLLITLAFGRAWCGWACPQTTLVDLCEWFARRIGVDLRAEKMTARPWQQLLLHGFYAALTLLVALNLLWYFLSPYEFFSRLAHAELPAVAGWFVALVALPVYLDLALVRRLLCREFCPYGRFQTALVDAGTLTLRFHPAEARRCIRCNACVRACPTGIDIRRGYQIECINCGRCLDACREIMARRRQPGIIRYTFGEQGRGLRALVNGRMLLVCGLFTAVCLVLIVALARRDVASLRLARPETAPMRVLEDGRVVNLFSAVVASRGRAPLTLGLTGVDRHGRPLALLGPVTGMSLHPGERRRVEFSVLLAAGERLERLTILLHDEQGRILAREEAVLLLPRELDTR